MYELEFTIQGLPPILSNGSHGHWAYKAKIKKEWKELACLAISMQKKPVKPLEKAYGLFTRFSTREPDSDNLAISFKSVRDALVKAGIILDDKNSILKAEYDWKFAKRNEGKITVRIMEVRVGTTSES